MDALVAVGLAGNVVQFVQFAGQLISETAEIQKTGGPSSLPGLRKLAADLTKQAEVLTGHLVVNRQNRALVQEEQYLLDVALDCQKAGNQILAYFDSLIDSKSSPNLLRSTQASLKFILKHHSIENFVSKLEKFRNVLCLGTILALRTSTDEYNERILSHLEALRLANQAAATNNVKTFEEVQTLIDIIQSQSGSKLDTIQAQTQLCLDQIGQLREELPQTLEKAILRWLNFRQMSWRYEEVPLAYQKTFQWIFKRQSKESDWDDLSAHLTMKDVSTPYWINGKAGSGKSTLMKFIVNDFRTQEALARWAGDDRLLVLKFFFWNLGTPLQKSNIGMLRALLHSVLEKHPELIPAVFPGLYQNWKDSDADNDPTYVELKKAFELLIEKSAGFLKLCIFADGVDELEGDHKDVSLFLRSLASPKVKLIISSRPINACIHAFQGCPTLRLQYLTKHDIEIFVKGNLSSHQSMVRLTERFPQEAKELVTEIRTKSEGVFLWVKLVVRLLVDGLENGDGIKDLQKKLRLLPPDLRELYHQMIDKMQPDYRTQAAKLFQLFHTWNSIITDQPLRALVLSFAHQPPPEVFARAVAPLEIEALEWLLQQTKKRVRSRCCGLIEIRRKPRLVADPPSYIDRINESVVNYLHRTVAEFLLSDDVWEEICRMADKSSFDPILNLTYGSLSTMNVQCRLTEHGLRGELVNIQSLCRHATNLSDQALGELISAIDQTMQQHWKVVHDENLNSVANAQAHWSADFFVVRARPSGHDMYRQVGDVCSFAVRIGLVQYLRAFGNFPSRNHFAKTALVVHALESWLDSPQRICLHDRADTLLLLLQNAARPEGDMLWRRAVSIGYELVQPKPVDCAELLRLFLIAANPGPGLLDIGAKDLICALKHHNGRGMAYDDVSVGVSDIEHLGLELEKLAHSNAYNHVSQRFVDTVSGVSSISATSSGHMPARRQSPDSTASSNGASQRLPASLHLTLEVDRNHTPRNAGLQRKSHSSYDFKQSTFQSAPGGMDLTELPQVNHVHQITSTLPHMSNPYTFNTRTVLDDSQHHTRLSQNSTLLPSHPPLLPQYSMPSIAPMFFNRPSIHLR